MSSKRRQTEATRAYYTIRDSLPPHTCPQLNRLLELCKGNPEALELVEQVREQHESLRAAAKAAMLLAVRLEQAAALPESSK